MVYNYRRSNRRSRRAYSRGVRRTYSSRYSSASAFRWKPVNSRSMMMYNGDYVHTHDKYAAITNAGYTTTPSFTLLSDIPIMGAGTVTNSRSSAFVKPLELVIRGYVQWPEAGSDQMIRVMVFQWTDDTAVSTPIIGNVIDTSTGPANYMINPPTSGHFFKVKVLYDSVITPPPVAEGAHTAHYTPFNVQIRAGMRPVQFHTSASATGKNHFYLLVWSATSNSSPPVFIWSRLRFHDY